MDAAITVYRDPPTWANADPRFRGATKTQYPIGRGTRMLKDYIAPKYAIRTVYMPGRSRVMLPSQMLDMHQHGRAIDFMTSDLAKGTAICEELIALGDRIGLQCIIFAGNIYSQGQRPGANRFRRFSGASGHYDHPHVELSPAGASGDAPWFTARAARPTDAELLADSRGPEAPLMDEGSGITGALLTAGVAVAALAALAGVVFVVRA